MGSPPDDLCSKARKIVDLYDQMRRPGVVQGACYRDLPNSSRLRYETLSWDNYRTLLSLFGQDSSPFVMPSLRVTDQLDEYAAYQLALGRYSGKRGTIDWLLRLENGTYVGVLHLYNVSYELWNGKRTPCMVGYAITEAYRRNGFAEEALSHLLSRLPDDFKLFEAQAEPLEINDASRTLLEKVGFRFERNFKNSWGSAVLYRRKLVRKRPYLSWKELQSII